MFGKHRRFPVFCYGDEENARIYAMHLTTANQSEIRRAYLVSVVNADRINNLNLFTFMCKIFLTRIVVSDIFNT